MKTLRLWKLRMQVMWLEAHHANAKAAIAQSLHDLAHDRKRFQSLTDRMRKARSELAAVESPRRMLDQMLNRKAA